MGMGWIVINSTVLRGGNWNNAANAGPFCANLNNGPTNTNNNIGFRCCNRSQSQNQCLHGDKEQCKGTTSIQIQAETSEIKRFLIVLKN